MSAYSVSFKKVNNYKEVWNKFLVGRFLPERQQVFITDEMSTLPKETFITRPSSSSFLFYWILFPSSKPLSPSVLFFPQE